MLPPCDPTVLDKNPQFKKLHQHLTTNILNPDGTTKTDDGDPARRAVAEELKTFETREAKRQILKDAIRRVALDSERNNALPDDLRDTSAIIALFLSLTIPFSDEFESDVDRGDSDPATSLLARDIDKLHEGIPDLAPRVSDVLASDVETLRSILAAAPDPSTEDQPDEATRTRSLRRRTLGRIEQPKLSTQLADRLRRLRNLQLAELPAARRRMAITAAEVLAARAALIEQVVILLERAKHGALARAAKAQADHLATVAEGMEGKVQVMKLETLSTIYTPEVVTALRNYREHLQETRARLQDREKAATKTLQEYEGGRHMGGAMADIARRYGALLKEADAIRMEMERLGM